MPTIRQKRTRDRLRRKVTVSAPSVPTTSGCLPDTDSNYGLAMSYSTNVESDNGGVQGLGIDTDTTFI